MGAMVVGALGKPPLCWAEAQVGISQGRVGFEAVKEPAGEGRGPFQGAEDHQDTESAGGVWRRMGEGGWQGTDGAGSCGGSKGLRFYSGYREEATDLAAVQWKSEVWV